MSDVEQDTSEMDDGEHLEFSDTVEIETGKDDLWATISDPEALTKLVPGAEEVERLSKRKYSVTITLGVSHLTVSMDGEAEFVEMNEPDWIVVNGSAHDTKTGSDFDVLAAMEMEETAPGETALTYQAEIDYTGGVASLGTTLLRPVVNRKVDTYFQNVKDEVED
ncbi:MAG: CoxG family protein [Halanaeroarchaeum sp.]